MDAQIEIGIAKPIDMDVKTYHDQAWNVLQYLHDHDPKPWPTAIPTDPNDALWSFCFDGEPLFINISSPAHALRSSRNLGDGLALVIQPRVNFDHVAGLQSPGGEEIRQRIRQRMHAYDGQPHPTDLGTYGQSDNIEWKQYALNETNTPTQNTCPLKIQDNSPTKP